VLPYTEGNSACSLCRSLCGTAYYYIHYTTQYDPQVPYLQKLNKFLTSNVDYRVSKHNLCWKGCVIVVLCIFMVEIVQIVMFWVMSLCSIVGGHQCCKGTCCLHLQGLRVYVQEFVYVDKLWGRWSNLRRRAIERWVVSGCFEEHGIFSSQVGIGVMGNGSPSRELFSRKDSGIMWEMEKGSLSRPP
jgi:hypothetical protein